MAIIKYTLLNGQCPSYITDGGWWKHPADKTYVGIGSGGGTELTKDELKTYVKTLPNLWHLAFDETGRNITESRAFTEAELETQVNNWCTARGIS